MKRLLHVGLTVLTVFAFVRCDNNEVEDPFQSELKQGAYVVNFGNYGSGGASISKYDYLTGTLTNFYNEEQNGGREFLSNIQYAYPYNDSVFLIGNAPDQIITLNPLMVQSRNGLTDQIANPRFCVAIGDYLYISCWGLNPDYNKMPASYIAKYKIGGNTIERTFDLPGGPEGMEIANGKLFIALNYKDSIAVFDLNSEQFSYIETPAVSSYFLKDLKGNLYVTLVSTFNNYSTQTGLGYINTVNNKLESIYNLDNVSSSYGSVMAANANFTHIFVTTSAYDANWNLTGAVADFNVVSKLFNTNNFVDNVSGISGVSVNAFDNNVYVFSAQSVTGAGTMHIYSSAGEKSNSLSVGAFPVGSFFIE